MNTSHPDIQIDRLAGIFTRTRVRARVFHTDRLCGIADFSGADGFGHLHLLRGGSLAVNGSEITAPAALLYPRPLDHRLTGQGAGADLVCAEIDLGGAANPLWSGLPDVAVVPLKQTDQGLAAILTALFWEAEHRNCGRQAVMDSLAEAAMIHILRISMNEASGIGVASGLAHPNLARALTALHDDPGADWSLETLADIAGLSRSSFAETFHRVVGISPGRYLTQWRLSLARDMLLRGASVKATAKQVGYSGPAALSRAFSAQYGTSIREAQKGADHLQISTPEAASL